jgi:hypothetical protein
MVWKGSAPAKREVSTVVHHRDGMIGTPFGAMTICHFALDHRRPQVTLAGVVGRFDHRGEIAEGQQCSLHVTPIATITASITPKSLSDDTLLLFDSHLRRLDDSFDFIADPEAQIL